MTTTTEPAPRRQGSGIAAHAERLLFALVIVGIVALGLSRFTGSSDGSGAPTAAPAAARSLEDTVTELEAKVQRDPGNATTWQLLTQAYVQRAAQTLDPAFYERASSALAQATRLAPDDAGTLAAGAALSASLHHFADAESQATRAVEANPYDSAAMAVLVDAQIELGRYSEAERSLQSFANRKPGAPVLSRVSYLRELRGDLVGARAAMTEARQAAAGASAFQRATLAAYDGDLLLGQGDVVAAGVAYDQALELEPRHPIATVGHAKVLAAGGRVSEAIDLLSAFVERTPVPAAATLLGELQEMDGRTADSEQSFELVRALGQLQAAAGVDVDLDLALFEADHTTPSATSVERARSAYADRGTVYGADALAWTLFRSGDATGARDLLDESLALGTRDATLHYHAAAILDATGDLEGARVHMQFVIDTNPRFSFGLQHEAADLARRLGLTWPTLQEAR